MLRSLVVKTPGSEGVPETTFEYWTDMLVGLCFLFIAIISAHRMSWSKNQGNAETTVVTAFYSLILMTSVLRTLWFVVPTAMMEKSYVPHAVMAFDKNEPSWVGAFVEELLLSAGSLCLFSIFILILVYWADILKKYFYPGSRRSRPMVTFLTLVAFLIIIEIVNAILFLGRVYSSEGMILVDAILLALVSVICVCEITIFSHRFRTVLKTLGAINQVSTESQVKRIVWITVTGNLFFFTRALLESIFAIMLIAYWHKNGTVSEVFSHKFWDTYIIIKHLSEVAILSLMLYILQSRFTAGPARGGDGYEQVPNAEQGEQKTSGNVIV